MMDAAAGAPAQDAEEPALAEVRFVAPLLGLEHLSRFALVELEEGSPVFTLQSLEQDGVQLVVMVPSAVFTGYDPAFDGVARAALGLAPEQEPLLLVVLTAGESLARSTVNLLAPIAVNPADGRAAQIVLTGSDYPLRAPLAA